MTKATCSSFSRDPQKYKFYFNEIKAWSLCGTFGLVFIFVVACSYFWFVAYHSYTSPCLFYLLGFWASTWLSCTLNLFSVGNKMLAFTNPKRKVALKVKLWRYYFKIIVFCEVVLENLSFPKLIEQDPAFNPSVRSWMYCWDSCSPFFSSSQWTAGGRRNGLTMLLERTHDPTIHHLNIKTFVPPTHPPSVKTFW